MEKIPYMLIIGEKEVQENVVSVRSRKDGVLGSMSLEAFLEKALTEIREKQNKTAGREFKLSGQFMSA